MSIPDGDLATRPHACPGPICGSQLPRFRRGKAFFCSLESLLVGTLDEPVQVQVGQIFLWCQFVKRVEQDRSQGHYFGKQRLFR